MPRLIIGHLTGETARVWVRGSADNPVAFVDLLDSSRKVVDSKSARLEERHFYTGVVDFEGLTPRRVYYVRLAFGRGFNTPADAREVPDDSTGRLRTFPAAGAAGKLDFLFGSCNLHTLGPINPPGPAYKRLAAKADAVGADFVLHCGDQIYYDRPRFNRAPDVDDYRRCYLDAWDDNKEARRLLTQLPHYMILDDHEIRDDFHNDMEVKNGSIDTLKDFSLKVYREFQHIHNPQTYGNECLYYDFAFGDLRFFVLDTRTERWRHGASQMIGHQQLDRLLAWLSTHRDAVKFVVTSVPFVTEITNTDDKWSSPPYRPQRDRILEHIADEKIPGVVFLTGDMHNSHHAEMTLQRGPDTLVLHELMSSPISQLGKQSRSRYLTDQAFSLSNGWAYSTRFAMSRGEEEFFTGHSNAVHVSVAGREVGYTVFRTKKSRDEMTGQFVV